MGVSAERVRQLLSWRGRINVERSEKMPDPTEVRLKLDRLFARGGRLGGPGGHSA